MSAAPNDQSRWAPLVAIEGPSGCGKSSLIPALQNSLASRGFAVRAVSNNDIGRWSELIRDLAKTPSWPLTLAYATAGARAELREANPTGPALICDRFVLSSFVYQGFAGVPTATLRDLNAPVMKNSRTFMLTVTASELQARRDRRQRAPTDWFKERLSARAEIELYEDAASQFEAFGQTVCLIDAAPPIAVVADLLAAQVEDWLSDQLS